MNIYQIKKKNTDILNITDQLNVCFFQDASRILLFEIYMSIY